MIKTIEVITDPAYGSANLVAGLPLKDSWDCDVLQCMMLTGYLTAPPRYRGFHLSTFWAWLRYPPAIAAGPLLTLRRAWSEMDAHQKTVLADDFGMGFSSHYLVENFGFEDFADTGFLLRRLLKPFTSHVTIPARGPAKAPDFIAVDSAGGLHILECKGTQSSRAYLKTAMKKGIGQKNNLSNGTLFRSCMVGGIFVPLYNSQEEAQVVFIDPEPDELYQKLKATEPDKISAEIRRLSFAKSLSAAGLWRCATAVYDGKVGQNDVQFIKNLADGELRFAGFEQQGTTWMKKVEYRSFEADAGLAGEPAFRTTLEISVPEDIITFFRDSVSQNGQLSDAATNHWIESTLKRRRRTVIRSISAPTEQNPTRREERPVLSSWDGETRSETASALTTSTGIGLAMDRAPY